MMKSFFCFLLVIALHIAIICVLHLKSDVLRVSLSPARYLQYVTIIPPTFFPQISTTQVKAANLRMNPITNSEPAMPAIIEPITEAISAQPNVLPKLDLDALRTNAARYELDRKRSSIEVEQERNRRNQRLEARLEKGANEAKRSDCRTSYAQTGLLAPLFITADLLSEQGCKF